MSITSVSSLSLAITQSSNQSQSSSQAKKSDATQSTDDSQSSTATTASTEVKTEYSTTNARETLNAQLVDNLSVSLNAGSQPQALLYSAAIDKINELLAPTMGKDAIQNAAKNDDNSAEATAKRILSASTGMFGAYAAQHPEMDKETQAKNFVDLVRGGFEKGYGDAKDILKGLKVLSGDVESGIQKTYDLVEKGFDDFLAQQLKPKDDSSTNSGTNNSTTTTGKTR